MKCTTRIIYHTPVPLDPSSAVGCGIRPMKMLRAFQAIGCDVDVVAGSAAERQRAIKQIKSNIKNDIPYAFCYSESPSLPTLLSESHRFPVHPFLDFGFFEFLRGNDIKIGLFYRDIYWLVNEYPTAWGPVKNAIATWFYKYDLQKYKKLVDRLYLPSLEMGEYLVGLEKTKMAALPPGCDSLADAKEILQKSPGEKLRLLYVGGIGHQYQMHELFRAVSQTDVELTICTREKEWAAVQSEYVKYLSSNIKIVHKSGRDLNGLYDQADAAVLFVKPDLYRTFAAPLKLYEYIGKGKPIIATNGTLVGDFVRRENIGWSIEYSSDELRNLLMALQADRGALQCKGKQIFKIFADNTWEARAFSVVCDFDVEHGLKCV